MFKVITNKSHYTASEHPLYSAGLEGMPSSKKTDSKFEIQSLIVPVDWFISSYNALLYNSRCALYSNFLWILVSLLPSDKKLHPDLHP